VFRGNGEVYANMAVPVLCVGCPLHQVLLKGRSGMAWIGMKLDQALGNIDQIQAFRSKQGIKDRFVLPFFEKPLQVQIALAMALRRSSWKAEPFQTPDEFLNSPMIRILFPGNLFIVILSYRLLTARKAFEHSARGS